MIQFKNLNTQTWRNLEDSGSGYNGYNSIELANKSDRICGYIFKDQNSKYHFAIPLSDSDSMNLTIPKFTGISVQVATYLINGDRKKVVDGVCESNEFLDEFSGVLKEILLLIQEEQIAPLMATQTIISAWVSFWSRPNDNNLNIEEQIGLLAELQVFKKLMKINLPLALECWHGPLRRKFDFTFTDWSFEIKATRSDRRKHIVNGIDQLEPLKDKKLGLVSFQFQSSNGPNCINLAEEVRLIRQEIFRIDKSKFIDFACLLSSVGYNFAHSEDYESLKVEIINADLFIVDKDFPALTSSMITPTINPRIENVRYDIILDHLKGVKFDDISLGNYFY